MKIRSVDFVKSVFDPVQLPKPGLPEIALCGRSNVGKSSLINTLLHRRIAKTSSVPGRTRSINFVLVNHSFFFVDLPGYGYARVPDHIQKNWQRLIESYLQYRPSLRCVVLIVDARRDPSEDETSLVQWLEYNNIPWILVLTKIDKLPRREHAPATARWEHVLHPRSTVCFSSLTAYGTSALWKTFSLYLQSQKIS